MEHDPYAHERRNDEQGEYALLVGADRGGRRTAVRAERRLEAGEMRQPKRNQVFRKAHKGSGIKGNGKGRQLRDLCS